MASGEPSSSMACKRVPVINESDIPSGSIENKMDKLKVDGKIYEVGDINHLPPHLEPINACTHKTDNMVLFFGKHSPLSNMHMCSIALNGQDYSSVQQ